MREDVLRSLAARASSDRTFLSGLRRAPEATLAANGFDLTREELDTVLDLRRRTAALGDGMVAALLAGGLRSRAGGGGPSGGGAPSRPGSPGRSLKGPGRPRPPGWGT